jgi:DNA-binding transcriptional regulator YdaS (Cro superfamily)
MSEKTGIEQVIELAEKRYPDSTGREVLARQLGVTIQAVSQWSVRGWCPPARALEIEDLYGVPRRLLVKPELRELLG